MRLFASSTVQPSGTPTQHSSTTDLSPTSSTSLVIAILYFVIEDFIHLIVVSDEVRRLGLSDSKLWSVSKLLQERKDTVDIVGNGSSNTLVHSDYVHTCSNCY